MRQGLEEMELDQKVYGGKKVSRKELLNADSEEESEEGDDDDEEMEDDMEEMEDESEIEDDLES